MISAIIFFNSKLISDKKEFVFDSEYDAFNIIKILLINFIFNSEEAIYINGLTNSEITDIVNQSNIVISKENNNYSTITIIYPENLELSFKIICAEMKERDIDEFEYDEDIGVN